ncbi:FHIPEP family type III secretion protein [Bradyrhizobium sp. USDA 4353]
MTTLQNLLTWAGARRDLVVVMIIVTAIVTMILPMPTVLVDFLIALNIGLSILLLMVAFFLTAPVEFSALPAIILISTVFRLSISISTSRLVLVQADAGAIIRTFGEFVIAQNVTAGLVVFLIITIVQFVVITKGSERVAEVAARFTLDALPGKQMSIDADLRNGDINQLEARRRRRLLERESQLYGAMDGAMKFVKGDAIAGLIIIAVNLIGGIAVGTLQHKLRLGEAVQIYSLLTIGDGLISQIPALFVSMAAGTVVTRVTTDGSTNLGSDVVGQIAARPDSLRLAGLIMFGLAWVPGFPAAIFLLLGATFGGIGLAEFLGRRSGRQPRAAGMREAVSPGAGLAMPALPTAPIMVVAEPLLFDQLRRGGFEERVRSARQEVADRYGFACPVVGFAQASDLDRDHYRIELNAVPLVVADVRHEAPRIKSASAEASSGANDRPDASIDMMTQQLRQFLVRHAAEFLGIQEAKRLLARLDGDYADLVREAQRVVPLPRMTDVLRRLLEEQVSISNLRLILETLVEWGGREASSAALAEQLRLALKRQICFSSADARQTIRCLVLERETEALIRSAGQHADGVASAADPELAARLVDRVTASLAAADRADGSRRCVVLTSSDIRRVVWGILVKAASDVSVLSYQEIAPGFSVEPVETIRIAGKNAA